jgi:hypothetical protein
VSCFTGLPHLPLADLIHDAVGDLLRTLAGLGDDGTSLELDGDDEFNAKSPSSVATIANQMKGRLPSRAAAYVSGRQFNSQPVER